MRQLRPGILSCFGCVQAVQGASPAPNCSSDETFASLQAQTTLIVPTGKDQCKNDGWRNYALFNNQGDCVSFVEHQDK
jgi:hypothetical protein